jgi:hypothetical protein
MYYKPVTNIILDKVIYLPCCGEASGEASGEAKKIK